MKNRQEAAALLSVLQWGRDHLIAEMTPNWRRPRRHISTLQWGRDHLIAEIKLQATFVQTLIALQWGRDHLIAEMWQRERLAYSA